MKWLFLFFALPALAAAAAAPAPDPVGFEQRNGEQLPLGTRLTDGRGFARPLGAYFGTRPVVLIFNYFRCPVMCSWCRAGRSTPCEPYARAPDPTTKS